VFRATRILRSFLSLIFADAFAVAAAVFALATFSLTREPQCSEVPAKMHFMPGFQRSVAVLPLPLRAITEMLETSFRIRGDEVTRTLFGCSPTAERQNRIRFYLLRNGGYGTTAGGNGNGATEFFYVGNVILTALTEFLRKLCNGNGETATAERQRNAGNYRHYCERTCIAYKKLSAFERWTLTEFITHLRLDSRIAE